MSYEFATTDDSEIWTLPTLCQQFIDLSNSWNKLIKFPNYQYARILGKKDLSWDHSNYPDILFCSKVSQQEEQKSMELFELGSLIFYDLHNLIHPGIKASVRLVKSRYFWQDIDKDVRIWSRECHPCQVSKVHRHTKSPILPLDINCGRSESVHIDIVGPLSSVHSPLFTHFSHSYILTCIDRSTNWVKEIPLPDISTKAVAFAFLHGWVSRFGVPLYVITDRGTQLESEFFSELSSMVGFHRLGTTSYHPQCNGEIERVHHVLKASLKARGGDGLLSLPFVLLALRSMPDSSGISSFLLVTKKAPLFPQGLLSVPPCTISSGSDFIKNFVLRMKELDYRIPAPLHHTSFIPYIPPDLFTSYFFYTLNTTRSLYLFSYLFTS
ncbi:UNVERIFIED_CONTAM: hypothetical protein RMT77_017840 [Armadillidium vulgare]